MACAASPYDGSRLATVFGGSGFVGRHIVRAFATTGWRVRVAVRRPDLAGFLRTAGVVGQIEPVQANLRYPSSIAAAIEDAEIVVNATGVRVESGAQTFRAVHVDGARALASAARAAGIRQYVHVSGIGADPNASSAYIASKGLGEVATFAELPQAVVLRPSVVFGPEDDFFNRFAALSRFLPIIPLFAGGGTKLQPVYVGDVGLATVAALSGQAPPGSIYELGGPEVMTLMDSAALALRTVGRKRMLIGLPLGPSRVVASLSGFASRATLGLYPKLLTTTRDQVDLLASDNVVSAEAETQGRVLRGLGVDPQGAEAIIPTYLVRFRKTGQYEVPRSA